MTLRLSPGDRLLFVGDSVTSCGYETIASPWGAGYVLFLDVLLATRFPEHGIELVNRGHGGDTIVDLERRWERDVIEVEHDWLFIMIGVNDVSFRHLEDLVYRAVSDDVYRETYRRLLVRSREAGLQKIVLLEPTPFLIDPDHPAHEEIRTTCGIITELAEEFGTELCRLHERFRDYIQKTSTGGWMLDHVHPSLRGHGIIATSILEHLGGPGSSVGSAAQDG